jgi:signal transduction histidine kinase
MAQSRRPTGFFSLQTKLIAAFVLIVLIGLALTGGIFVYSQRGEQEQQALDRVLAAAPTIYGSYAILQERGVSEPLLERFVAAAADEFDARVLLVDRLDGTVLVDSGDELAGEQLVLPDDFTLQRAGRLRPYVSFRPLDDAPGGDLIFVSPTTGRFQGAPRFQERLALLLAVPEATVRDAWRGLLPELTVAGLIALPVAAVLAVLVARYISRPLEQLTEASQQMARGNYDVEVSVDRSDEVGRLAQSFTTMARRVGETHAQMRALVANVSHDLKTPLTSILGFAQALRDGRAEDDAEVRRMGAVVYEEAGRLRDRLNDLLYLSEIESGQAVLSREAVDLRRLIEPLVRRIEADAAERDVSLHVDISEGLTVSADGAKLERALENLLDNARKYTPAGGEVRVRARAEGGGYAIEVANTAPDLTPEELPRLFERFYRRDRARGRDATGSGLGLPIARELVELHGGTLDARIIDGELVLTVRLPG